MDFGVGRAGFSVLTQRHKAAKICSSDKLGLRFTAESSEAAEDSQCPRIRMFLESLLWRIMRIESSDSNVRPILPPLAPRTSGIWFGD